MKWEPVKTGFQLPSVCRYTARHVNVLRNMLERHVKIPHRLICVTDNAANIDPRIEIVPLWDKCLSLGGCYNRLWVFSKEAGEIFGERFVCIDLDCVIVKDCTDLFTRDEDFVINSYNPTAKDTIDQHYNGSMFMVTAGARAQLWDEFDPESSPTIVQADPDTIGTDQAWIRHVLGKEDARWGNADGVYEARQINHYLLPDAKIVFFSGRRDPSEHKYRWVQKHWN